MTNEPPSLPFTKKKKNNAKSRHPLETTTAFYLECSFIFNKLGMTWEEWDRTTSEAEKMLERTFFRLEAAKTAYGNMSEEDRYSFLM